MTANPEPVGVHGAGAHALVLCPSATFPVAAWYTPTQPARGAAAAAVATRAMRRQSNMLEKNKQKREGKRSIDKHKSPRAPALLFSCGVSTRGPFTMPVNECRRRALLQPPV